MDPEQQISHTSTTSSKKYRGYKKCSVAECPHTGKTKEVALFGFPKRADVQRRLRWAHFCQRGNWQPGVTAVMCSAHFSPEDLRSNAHRLRLKKCAVPSICSLLPELPEVQSKAAEKALDQRVENIQFHRTPFRQLSSTIQQIHCAYCNKFLEEPCYKHSENISDKPTIPYAVASLPDELSFGLPSNSRSGKVVFANETLLPMTVFGPLVGILLDTVPEEEAFVCRNTEDNARRYFQLDSDQTSNWMKFVRFAEAVEEQNAVVFEIGAVSSVSSHIVFVTTRTISPGEELKIGYSKKYASIFGHGVAYTNEEIEPAPVVTCEENSTWINMAEQLEFVKHTADVPCTKRSMRKRKKISAADAAAMPSLLPASDDCLMQSTVSLSTIDIVDNFSFSTGSAEHLSCSKDGGEYDAVMDSVETDNSGTDYEKKKAPKRHRVTLRTPCPVCGKIPRKPLEHMNIIHPEYVKMNWEFPCDQCSRRFPTDAVYRSHVFRGHPSKIPLSIAAKESAMTHISSTGHFFCRCDVCGVNFPVVGLLELHRLQCHGETVPSPLDRTCPACDFVGSTYTDLLPHIAEHTVPKGAAQMPCLLCGKYVTKLTVHAREQHPEEMKIIAAGWPFQCGKCGERFAWEKALLSHAVSHRADKYQCVYCARQFDAPTYIMKHVIEHKVDGRFGCPHCYKWFDKYFVLSKHFKDYHDVRRNRRCETCGVLFRTCSEFRLHKKSHSLSEGS